MSISPIPAAPVTLTQFYLVNRCGHSLTRSADGAFELAANPDRTDDRGGIPEEDFDAAEVYENAHSTLPPYRYAARACLRSTDRSTEIVSGCIGDYDPWPQGWGPKSRARRIMTRQELPVPEVAIGVSNAGTHVRGSMLLRR